MGSNFVGPELGFCIGLLLRALSIFQLIAVSFMEF
jgi:hypothetical protein